MTSVVRERDSIGSVLLFACGRRLLPCQLALEIATVDAERRVGAKPLEKRGGLRPGLDAESLLRALRDAVRCPVPEVLSVDRRAVLHEVLDHFVEPAEG